MGTKRRGSGGWASFGNAAHILLSGWYRNQETPHASVERPAARAGVACHRSCWENVWRGKKGSPKQVFRGGRAPQARTGWFLECDDLFIDAARVMDETGESQGIAGWFLLTGKPSRTHGRFVAGHFGVSASLDAEQCLLYNRFGDLSKAFLFAHGDRRYAPAENLALRPPACRAGTANISLTIRLPASDQRRALPLHGEPDTGGAFVLPP